MEEVHEKLQEIGELRQRLNELRERVEEVCHARIKALMEDTTKVVEEEVVGMVVVEMENYNERVKQSLSRLERITGDLKDVVEEQVRIEKEKVKGKAKAQNIQSYGKAMMEYAEEMESV